MGQGTTAGIHSFSNAGAFAMLELNFRESELNTYVVVTAPIVTAQKNQASAQRAAPATPTTNGRAHFLLKMP